MQGNFNTFIFDNSEDFLILNRLVIMGKFFFTYNCKFDKNNPSVEIF